MKRIILDPGHDPKFPGARKIFDEVTKARQIAAFAYDQLKKEGFDITVVPDGLGGNTGNENLIHKIEWINQRFNKDDALISIHCNAGGGEGSEVFYYAGDNYSKGVAEVYSNLISQITGAPNRGAKPDTSAAAGRLGIIRQTKPIPAVLSENGFVDNINDSTKRPELYAEAIHQFVHYLTGTTCAQKVEIKDSFEQKYYDIKKELQDLLAKY